MTTIPYLRDGVIKEPVRTFAPGFGAGAVAGYAAMRLDPAVMVMTYPSAYHGPVADSGTAPPDPERSSEDARLAFG